MNYRIHPDALLEAEEASEWYGDQEPALAVEFARQFRMLIAEIYERPRLYALAEDGPENIECRHVIHVGRFPYRIVYALVDDEVLVVAVAHHRHRPSYWHNRLDENT